MKPIKLIITTFLPVILLVACSGNSPVNTVKDSTTDNTSVSTPSSGDAVFSYNLDGTKISGGDADPMLMSNVASVTQSSDGNKVSFFLNDVYKDNTETFSHSLRFAIPDKTGNVALTADEDNFSVQLFVATSEEGKYIVYANESFNITVTEVSATRVSGTFSGQVKWAVGQTETGKNELTITDGKFDIPVSNRK